MRRRYLKIMSSLVPLGAAGACLLLGASLPAAAALRPASGGAKVAERLAAIRDAVFVIAPEEIQREDHRNYRPTWLNRWNNFARRRGRGPRPRWNNWRNGWPNWSNIWRNW